jgi:hypothetical protein
MVEFNSTVEVQNPAEALRNQKGDLKRDFARWSGFSGYLPKECEYAYPRNRRLRKRPPFRADPWQIQKLQQPLA